MWYWFCLAAKQVMCSDVCHFTHLYNAIFSLAAGSCSRSTSRREDYAAPLHFTVAQATLRAHTLSLTPQLDVCQTGLSQEVEWTFRCASKLANLPWWRLPCLLQSGFQHHDTMQGTHTTYNHSPASLMNFIHNKKWFLKQPFPIS